MPTFIQALSSVPRPPCEKYKCESRRHCGKERKACSAFEHYVATGNVKNPYQINGVLPPPSEAIFRRIFETSEDV